MALTAHGSTITFLTSSWSAEVLNITYTGRSRKALNSSHATTEWETMIPGRKRKPGQLRVRFWFDPDDPPPVEAIAENIRVTFPVPDGGSAGAQFQCSGFIEADGGFALVPGGGGNDEGLIEAEILIALSGEPTWTASS